MFRVLFPALLAGFLLACSGGSTPINPPADAPSPTVEAKSKTTAFDGARAFEHVKKQVEFGPRPAGSEAVEKTRGYLRAQLESYGLKVSVDEFTAQTPRGRVKFKNLIAELPGETSNVIILASHYDTKPYKEFVFLGANDGGSSTGALLELARVMASEKRKSNFTYQFVFFDGEEAFCAEWSECLNGKDNTYGSRHMVERLKKEQQLAQVKAMILLDMIGDKDLTLAKCEESSQRLVNAIWETAREAGHAKQFLSRTQAMTDDHEPFLEAGVLAVDIIDFEYGEGDRDNRYWHSKDDTIEKLSPDSLKIVGDVVLLSLPKIELLIR